MSIELEKSGLDRSQKIITIAKRPPVFCRESEKIEEAMNKILQTGHRRMPVISSGKALVGIATIMDILAAFMRGERFDERISTIMTRDVIFCKSDDLIGYVLQKFKISRRGGFPVLENNNLVAIVSERDFVKNFANVRFDVAVEELMTKKPFFVKEGISISDCLKSLVNTRYRRLPVVDGKRLTGIVTAVDLLKYLKQKDLNILPLKTPIENIVIKDVISVSKYDDVSDAIKLMKNNDIGGVPVVGKDKELEGIITERDILEEIV